MLSRRRRVCAAVSRRSLWLPTLVFIGRSPAPVPSSAQPATVQSGTVPSDTVALAKTLTVGERLTYDVKYGPLKVGRATMEVVGIEEVRGRRARHTRVQVTGGTLFFRVNDVLESWLDVETFSSLRFRQQLSEGSRARLSEYELYT